MRSVKLAILALAAALLATCSMTPAWASDTVASVSSTSAIAVTLAVIGFLWTALQVLTLFTMTGIRDDLRTVGALAANHESRLSRLEGEHNTLHGKRGVDRLAAAPEFK